MNNLAYAAAAYCLSVINRCSNDSCNFVLYCVRQLVTCLREKFDAVVFKRIVRSRNYYTGVSLNLTNVNAFICKLGIVDENLYTTPLSPTVTSPLSGAI